MHHAPRPGPGLTDALIAVRTTTDDGRASPHRSDPDRNPTLDFRPRELSDKRGEPYTIRAYRPSDRRKLEAMYSGFEPKRSAQGLPPAHAEGVRRWLDRVLAAGLHCVVEVRGGLCGHAMLMPFEEDTLELANFVHQAARDRGIGTEVNRAALDCAAAAGARRVWLSVEPANSSAIRSYEKVGFRRLPGSLWAPELEMAVEVG
jgi:RimJ/RimL family protein N-acetyltransferase